MITTMDIYMDSCGGASVHDWSPIRDSDHDFFYHCVVPEPYQAQDRVGYFDHHENSTLARYTEIDSVRTIMRGSWYIPRFYWSGKLWP